MRTAAEVLLVLGAAFTLLAAIGVLRFEDALARMHALSKASTLGFLLVLGGGALGISNANDVTFLVLAGVLQLLTSPVASNLIARATYRAEGIQTQLDGIDELAQRHATPRPPDAP
jgi:multicomponent Na+:H+ antiporter subunit G